MQVFKLFLKILKKNISMVVIYLVIFLILNGLMLNSNNSSENYYEKTKVDAYLVIEETSNSVDIFSSYLLNYINIIDIGGLSVEDALFNGEIDIYIFIPHDFEAKLINNEEEILTIQSIANNSQAFALLESISIFFNQVKTELNLNLSTKGNVFLNVYNNLSLKNEKYDIILTQKNKSSGVSQGFLFGFYVISALILNLVSLLVESLKSYEVKKRLNIGSISSNRINLIQLISSMGMAVIMAIVISFVPFIFISFNDVGLNIIYYIINNICLAIVFVALAYMLSAIIKSKMIIIVINIVLPLGGAFLCGLFVPKEFMSDTVLKFAQILPQYHAVSANEYISLNSNINVGDYIVKLLPYLGYSIVFITITLIFNRKNIKSEA